MSTTMTRTTTPQPACDNAGVCQQTGRRDFLRSAGGCVTLTLAALGLGATEALALPVFATEGQQSGGEHRYPIPPADSVNIDRKAQLIVARFQGRVFVFALSCPHQNAAVKWVQKDQRFQCTKHDSEYKPDGLYTTGHATRNLDRYAIRRDADAVVVDIHRWFQSDKNPDGWAAAVIPV
jgi:nitrite reductase/ring-hydroxylating ferredoxin subunit